MLSVQVDIRPVINAVKIQPDLPFLIFPGQLNFSTVPVRILSRVFIATQMTEFYKIILFAELGMRIGDLHIVHTHIRILLDAVFD